MSKNKNCKIASVGGQALLEGIMMQAPEGAAIAFAEQTENCCNTQRGKAHLG